MNIETVKFTNTTYSCMYLNHYKYLIFRYREKEYNEPRKTQVIFKAYFYTNPDLTPIDLINMGDLRVFCLTFTDFCIANMTTDLCM